MEYRVLCDENIERATVNYLRQLGHDVERVPEVSTLDEGDPDERLAEYSNATDRLILTQDQDFLDHVDPRETGGVLFQADQSLSGRQAGDIVDEMSAYVSQEQVTLEYVTEQWL